MDELNDLPTIAFRFIQAGVPPHRSSHPGRSSKFHLTTMVKNLEEPTDAQCCHYVPVHHLLQFRNS